MNVSLRLNACKLRLFHCLYMYVIYCWSQSEQYSVLLFSEA